MEKWEIWIELEAILADTKEHPEKLLAGNTEGLNADLIGRIRRDGAVEWKAEIQRTQESIPYTVCCRDQKTLLWGFGKTPEGAVKELKRIWERA